MTLDPVFTIEKPGGSRTRQALLPG
ncbi:hypothetical protein J2Z31_005556 [Sinorhizobium kostiense]|uniref:Uncharacterized protein n=1 Tax=Sinorhizobium kostiense TaxID=76747 RepID=A0ABS4R7Z4_9HYPH|nr:hypothetical protein [Sinorhizobium kostiense]